MLKEQNVAILTNLGFKVLEDKGDRVFLDSPGEDHFGPIVQAIVYANQAGTFSVSLDTGFCAPAVENEELLVNHLDQHFPGWRG